MKVTLFLVLSVLTVTRADHHIGNACEGVTCSAGEDCRVKRICEPQDITRYLPPCHDEAVCVPAVSCETHVCEEGYHCFLAPDRSPEAALFLPPLQTADCRWTTSCGQLNCPVGYECGTTEVCVTSLHGYLPPCKTEIACKVKPVDPSYLPPEADDILDRDESGAGDAAVPAVGAPLTADPEPPVPVSLPAATAEPQTTTPAPTIAAATTEASLAPTIKARTTTTTPTTRATTTTASTTPPTTIPTTTATSTTTTTKSTTTTTSTTTTSTTTTSTTTATPPTVTSTSTTTPTTTTPTTTTTKTASTTLAPTIKATTETMTSAPTTATTTRSTTTTTTTPAPTCLDVTCANKMCEMINGVPLCLDIICTCSANDDCIIADGTATCVKKPTCQGVVCSNNEECQLIGSQPQCKPLTSCKGFVCDSGEKCDDSETGPRCVKVDPCQTKRCRADQSCVVASGRARCVNLSVPQRSVSSSKRTRPAPSRRPANTVRRPTLFGACKKAGCAYNEKCSTVFDQAVCETMRNCRRVRCPEPDQTCAVRNSVPLCLSGVELRCEDITCQADEDCRQPRGEGPRCERRRTCADIQCRRGHVCREMADGPACGRPTCDDITCGEGETCESRFGTAKCRTLPTPPPGVSAICDNFKCDDPNTKCTVVRDKPVCARVRSCKNYNCRYDQECILRGGRRPSCVIRRSCEGIKCAGGKVCMLIGRLPRCVIAPTCKEINCAYNERCIHVEGVPTCLNVPLCYDKKCSGGKECRVVKNEHICVDKATCDELACGPGRVCSEYAGSAKCVTARTCQNTACRSDQKCELMDNTARCVLLHGAPCRRDGECAQGLECRALRGKHACVERASCDMIQCEAGQKCQVESGTPSCLPSCDMLTCPESQFCRVMAEKAGCVECLLDCPKRQVCRLVNPRDYADAYVPTTARIPACVAL